MSIIIRHTGYLFKDNIDGCQKCNSRL